MKLQSAVLISLIAASGPLLHAQVPAFEGFFTNETYLGEALYDLPGLGTVDAGAYPWIRSESFGSFHLDPSGSGPAGFWVHSPAIGWLWSREDVLPYFYNPDWREWYWFTGAATDQRWFYNTWTRAFQMEAGNPVDDLAARAAAAMEFAEARISDTIQEIPSPVSYPGDTTPGGAYGNWNTVGASNWVSGFFPSQLWLLYDWTGDPDWRAEADRWTAGLEGQKTNTTTHDIGFMLGIPYFLAYDLTGDTKYRDVLLTASTSLSTRFSPIVGAMRSWSWGDFANFGNFTVIIDNMMNLEMLMRAAELEGGQAGWASSSIQHAITSSREHVRDDGSTYHVVIFDENTGSVRSRQTYQGYNDESTWSRGQAWGIYGFTVMYRETGDTQFLDMARELADYFIGHLEPGEPVAPYDFESPVNPLPRDSSGSAVAASAFLELSSLETDPDRAELYLQSAREILFRLSHPDYLARYRDTQAILLQGSHRHGRYEQALIYGDYYFMEALLRYLRLGE